jgi:hypothetical protein
MRTNPTLPPHFTFDLALAKHGWPLTFPGGPKIERVISVDAKGQFPIILEVEGYGEFQKYRPEAGKIRLSADTTNPALRSAVEAAEKSGDEVSYKWQDEDWRPRPIGCGDYWDWVTYLYLPTRLLSQLPKPEPAWTLPEPPPGQQWFRTRRPLPSPPALWSCPADLGFPWPLLKHKDRPAQPSAPSAWLTMKESQCRATPVSSGPNSPTGSTPATASTSTPAPNERR